MTTFAPTPTYTSTVTATSTIVSPPTYGPIPTSVHTFLTLHLDFSSNNGLAPSPTTAQRATKPTLPPPSTSTSASSPTFLTPSASRLLQGVRARLLSARSISTIPLIVVTPLSSLASRLLVRCALILMQSMPRCWSVLPVHTPE